MGKQPEKLWEILEANDDKHLISVIGNWRGQHKDLVEHEHIVSSNGGNWENFKCLYGAKKESERQASNIFR